MARKTIELEKVLALCNKQLSWLDNNDTINAGFRQGVVSMMRCIMDAAHVEVKPLNGDWNQKTDDSRGEWVFKG